MSIFRICVLLIGILLSMLIFDALSQANFVAKAATENAAQFSSAGRCSLR